ncbi:L-aspartate oxidase [Vulcaniibacterium gelatinicum]|uniref:L-aspartate oxidase n=1 Tax=Vulcaniibacterium gelatinicum TaxID=2598725 RepID=UPI0011CA72C9|nr:FAD-binding protein [Vulcaniibacterium gelatinicum]
MSGTSPIVVVGAGVAGLSVALAAAPRPVLLLSRAPEGGDSATALAQGGIAAALAPGDTPAAHAEDTLLAGGGDNDRAAVALLTEGAAGAIAWLRGLGMVFDGDGGWPHFAREGGHRRARVLHAGGDATGAGLLRVLQAAVQRAPHLRHVAGVEVDALLQDGGRIVGVGLRDATGRRRQLPAAAVVLATGGIGGLFARTCNPSGAQGAGLALGLAAGAPMRDLELVQFHPTALDVATHDDAPLPLLTEALRGAGAVLRDERGRAIMRGEHPLADLAPRDVVARRIWRLQRQGHRVFLDCTALQVDWPTQFPTVLAACRAAGLDPRRRPLPVTPAAHFHMGGLATGLDGATGVPGLYAVGEVACNGVHGGNRLASNSLLEGVVFGQRLGRHLAQAALPPAHTGEHRELPRGPDADPADLRRLRQWLWQGLGPIRDAAGLHEAEHRIRVTPALAASWQGRVALAMLDAAQRQRRNRGAHCRSDAAPEPTCVGLRVT